LKSQDLEIWSSQTLKTSFKILLNSTVQRSFWFLWSIGWKNWGFSMIFLPVYRSRCRSA
jgi:hypothetical protein